MRHLLYFFLTITLLTSCMDVAMDVEVENTGAITYSGNIDLSSMIPMLTFAMEMEQSDGAEEDPIMTMLKSGERVDTIISIFDLDDDLTKSIVVTEEMKDKFRVRMLLDKENNVYNMSFYTRYNSIEEQNEFLEKLPKPDENVNEDLGEGSEMLTGLLASEVDLEKGILVFKSKLKEKVEDSLGYDEMNFGSGFGDALEPSLKLNLTLPGKVKSVEGPEFKKIDDWRISIKVPVETEDPDKEYTRIHFEPRSVFSKPEVTEVWNPKPVKVNFNGRFSVPTDAIILLGEKGTGAWTHLNGRDAQWEFENGIMTVKPGTGDIITKDSFGDCQLHIEWRIPVEEERNGQGKGNSGIFLQSKYEVQVLDRYKNTTYPNGQAGSIYKQAMPAVNATKEPGEWQTYDIIYKAPRFNKLGMKEEAAKITVIHNGVLIHNEQEIRGTTEYIGLPKNRVHGDAPLKLQDHSNKVSYRNIWIRKL